MEDGSRRIGSDDLKEAANLPSSSIDQDDHSPRSKKSSSSLSSTSSSEDTLQLEFDVNGNATTGFTSNHEHGSSKGSDSRHSEEDIPVSSMPDNEHSDNESLEPSSARALHDRMLESCSSDGSDGSITQCPEVQLMERNDDSGVSPSSYRFPSSVFSNTKSNNPMEWSVTSNESLFSIQMGNMSFQGDMFTLGKSGELYRPGDPYMHDPLIDYMSNQPPESQLKKSKADEDDNKKSSNNNNQPVVNVPNEAGKRKIDMDNGLCATPQAVETMKEVLLENADHSKEHVSPRASNYSNCPSHHSLESGTSGTSGASTRSFAFPVLAGDGARSGSSNSNFNGAKKHYQSKTKSGLDSSDPRTQEAEPHKAALGAGLSKWFSCACRCSLCS